MLVVLHYKSGLPEHMYTLYITIIDFVWYREYPYSLLCNVAPCSSKSMKTRLLQQKGSQ